MLAFDQLGLREVRPTGPDPEIHFHGNPVYRPQAIVASPRRPSSTWLFSNGDCHAQVNANLATSQPWWICLGRSVGRT